VTSRNRQAESFGPPEFLRRVAQRKRTDEDHAHTRTWSWTRCGWWSRRRRSGTLWTSCPAVQLVAERSGPAAEDAGRMTEGVLEVLAERLPDAEVDALAQ
jgi:hypothetical protein